VPADDDSPILCARCLKELTPGKGEFYIVDIDARADPTPPVLEENDDRDYESEINAIVAELNRLPACEANHQRLTLHLCLGCYGEWIEKPTG